MFISDKWTDYELLDASDGERLERWGKYTLIRPDPQIIWKSEIKDKRWEKADGIYRRLSSGGGSWIKKEMPADWCVCYGDLKFEITPMGFKHTGLFPEQAVNWDWIRSLIRKQISKGKSVKVINLFGYTGGATVAAAKEGAFVCHVDASKGMVAKAKQNAVLSGIPADKIRYIVDDCFKFVLREIRRGSKYDAVILDPPSFGRGPNGEKWIIEEGLDGLMSNIRSLLSDDPLFVLLNSYTTGLSPSSCAYVLHNSICKAYGGKIESEELGLPVASTGLALPCGASCRWTR